MFLGSETFAFFPGAPLTGQYVAPVGTRLLLALVGVRLPSSAGIDLGLSWGGYQVPQIGSDKRSEFGRWWQVGLFTLPEVLLEYDENDQPIETPVIWPTAAADFDLQSSGQHEGVALMFAAFNSDKVKASFAVNGKEMVAWGNGVDWVHAAVTDPPFSVVVTGGVNGDL